MKLSSYIDRGKKGSSFIEKNLSNQKFSLMKDANRPEKLNHSHTTDKPKKSNFNNRSLIRKANLKKTEIINSRNSVNINKNYLKNNNKFSFLSLFNKGMSKKEKKNSSNGNLYCINLNNTKDNLSYSINNNNPLNQSNFKSTNSFINNNDLNSDDSNEDNKLKLKTVEKEIKNKLIDMTTVIQDNRSLILNHKHKNSDIFAIEEESSFIKKTRKKKKKKIKRKKTDINKDRKIIRKKPLFDSLDEDEEIQENEDDYYYFNPEGNFILTLDTFMLISSFICFIYTPIQIAMSKCFCIDEVSFIKILLIIIDFIFIFDFFINFFRAYYNYEYKLIKNNKQILKKYFLGYFSIDLLEAIPFNLLITYFCLNEKKYKPDGPLCFANGINGVFSTIKVCSALKIMKVLKVMNKKRNSAYNYLLDIDDHLFERLFSLFNFTFVSLAAMNVFICLHIFIGNQSYPNWIIANDLANKPFSHIYVAALYGIIETLTTVGYGDVISDSFTEIIFQIILLSIGIVAYSWLITIIGNYVKNESKAEIKHSKDLTMLEEIRIEFPKMSFKLYNKIHQHLQSVSNQQKKIDLNILVNSLPYSIKNMVLFKIYDKYIKRFKFFIGCDNTDFISRVLTNFIPLFSMKKALLIRERENVENIFFVKSGKLSLNVILDRNNIKESIRSYIFEKFDDVVENETNEDKTISQNSKVIKESINGKIEKVQEGIQSIFNPKRQSMTGQSYHESRIEQEIGKCDLGGNDEDFEEANYKFLRIIEIKRNEHFGLAYMLQNKPSPLSLRVTSKKADLFILRKHDVINISKAYPSMWNKIYDKSMYNMTALSKKTVQILKRYCSCHGIILNKIEPKKSQKLDPLNLLEIKKIMEMEQKKQEEEQEMKNHCKTLKIKPKKSNRQKSISRRKKPRSNTQILNQKQFISNLRDKLIKKYKDNGPKLQFLKTLIHNRISCKVNTFNKIGSIRKSDIIDLKTKKTLAIKEAQNSDSSYEVRAQEFNKFKSENNTEQNKNIDLDETDKLDATNKIFTNEIEKDFPNTLSNFPPTFASFLKKRIIKKRYKNKKYYKSMCIKLIDTINNLTRNINEYNNNINLKTENENENISNNEISSVNNYNNVIFKNNNYLISNSNIIFPNNNYDLISSFSNNDQSHIFEIDKISINKNESFEIKSKYNNLNIISNGQYEKNKLLQNEVEQFIKSYNNNNINQNNINKYKITKTLDQGNALKGDQKLYTQLIDNISEIKSNSDKNSEKNDKKGGEEPIKQKVTKTKKKSLKKYSTIKKNKNVTFARKAINDSNKKRQNSSASIYSNNNNNNNSLNAFLPSENKIIKDNIIKKNEKSLFGKDKSKTFVKKIINKEDSKKDNLNKSQSRDYLNEFKNQETGWRNKNSEDLRIKTLNKLKTDNIQRQKSDEKKDIISDNEEKTNNNCLII